MAEYRYEARERGGAAVRGSIEAESRDLALHLLAERGLFPSSLEAATRTAKAAAPLLGRPAERGAAEAARAPAPRVRGGRVSRKAVTAFTRELATLLAATIPIPNALKGLAEEEENEALKAVLEDLGAAVRRGESLSAGLAAHPRLFSKLYTSMVRVGEEAGALDRVMSDLADLLEHEDEIRGEVLSAVAYPAFVLGMGLLTTFILLAFVLPRLFSMLQGMLDVLPLPTRVLLGLSGFFRDYWLAVLAGLVAAAFGIRQFRKSPRGGLLWDSWKLRLPVLGPVLRASALSRFARTLGTLAKAGVSLLPALEIVRHTAANQFLAGAIGRVADETRGGDSLAAPLRRLGLFPPTVVQMVAVGEETGRLDEMLLRVAAMEERQMRGRSRTLISLLGPALILLVGAVVGFVVIGLLLPIFRMSQAIR